MKKTFSQLVVELALEIPKGRVSTYGRIARAAGAGQMASQSITSILGKASNRPRKGKAHVASEKRIPFHRIVYADGRIWVSPKYRKERMKLYKKEGIKLDKHNRIENFRDVLYEFK